MNIRNWCIPGLNVSNERRQQMGKKAGEKRKMPYNLNVFFIECKEEEIKDR
jgi:hypothetical protein